MTNGGILASRVGNNEGWQILWVHDMSAVVVEGDLHVENTKKAPCTTRMHRSYICSCSVCASIE